MAASHSSSGADADSRSSEPRPLKLPYLPTLDGWRALAILSVMLSHDAVHRLGPLSTQWFYAHGHLGVDLFFAISGVLICSRLLGEEQASGHISLRGFYLRRVFRILPAAFVFLAALLGVKALVQLPVQWPEVLAAAGFVRNYTFTFSHFQTVYPFYTSHFWSLAVEEHFYLLLPGLLVVTPKRYRAAVLLGLAALISLHRVAPHSWLSFHTDMRLDGLLVPAALAVWLQDGVNRQRVIKAVRFAPVWGVVLLLLVTTGQSPRTTGLLIAWLTPLLILATMLHPQGWLGRLLEAAPLRFVGRISYSLYLWQQLFLIGHFGAGTARLGVLQSWPLNWLMILTCALLSFYLIEQPLIHLGHRLAPNVSAITHYPIITSVIIKG